jgi:hypothetical protein
MTDTLDLRGDGKPQPRMTRRGKGKHGTRTPDRRRENLFACFFLLIKHNHQFSSNNHFKSSQQGAPGVTDPLGPRRRLRFAYMGGHVRHTGQRLPYNSILAFRIKRI